MKSKPGSDTQLHARPSKHGSICVCYILCYRAPDYIRTQSLLHALEACHGVRLVSAQNEHKGFRRYLETVRSLLRIRSSEAPDAYILGFRGHETFWLVRWITRGKPLIFDALMSPYAALQEERKIGLFGSLLAPVVRRTEQRALSRADAVLTDTESHVDYYARTFEISTTKVFSVPVGAVETYGSEMPKKAPADTQDFSVLFYGSFLALHGIDVIVDAAARLKDLPIRFDFVGGRAIHARQLRRMCVRRNVVRYTYRRWVPFARLIEDEIPQASICLGGPFGGTPQARRVVTGKTSQCLALGKATVVGRIDDDYGFVDRVNCLLVGQNNVTELAEALRWAYENRSSLAEIGARGRRLYYERLSVRVIAERLSNVLRMVGLELPRVVP